MIRFRHRSLPFLRVLALTLFALSLVLQPVMAAVGEMHEFAHHHSGSHGHVVHDAETTVSTGEHDQGGADVLHLMLHFAHCCAGTVALLPSPKLIIGTPPADRLLSAKTAFPAQTRPESPFKPPIAV